MAGILGTLPSYGNVLGGSNATPGSSSARRLRRPQQPGLQNGQAGSQAPDGSGPTPQHTFAQLQQQGIARPAPPTAPPVAATPAYGGSQQANETRTGLQGAVNQALASPSRYDAPAFTQIRDAAYSDLDNQFGRQRESLDADLARRGLSASTFGANDLHDLAGAQARAKANLNAQLLSQAATTQAGDRTAAYGMGSDLAQLSGSQDLAAYGANAQTNQQNFGNRLAAAQFGQGQYDNATSLALSAAQAQGNQNLGQGNLALQVGQALGDINGQQTLGAQQLTQQGQQFNLQQALAEKLGVGNLGIEQQRANTEGQATTGQLALGQGQLSLAQAGQQQQSAQFGRQQTLAEQLGLGGLSLQQQQLGEGQRQFNLQQALAQQLGVGSLGVQQQQAQTEAQRAANESAYQQGQLGLGQGQLSLAQTGQQQQYGLGLSAQDIQRQQLEQQGGQFQQQFGLSRQLGLGNLSLDQQRVALDQMVQTGQLTLAQKNQALQELQNTQQYGMAQQQFGEGQRQFNLQQALAQQLGTGNLSLQQQQLSQQGSQFGQDLALRQRTQEQGNTLAQQQLTQQGSQFGQDLALRSQLGTGQLDVSRYQAEADANLARQNLLLQVIGALGLGTNGATGASGAAGGSGGGTYNPYDPPFGGGGPSPGGGITMPGSGGPPHGGLTNLVPTDSFAPPYGGNQSPSQSSSRMQPIYQNGQWWDPSTGWSMDGRNYSSAIASVANVRGQPMMQGGQPFQAPTPLMARGNPLYEANPGVPHDLLDDSYTGRQLFQRNLAAQLAGQARGNYGRPVPDDAASLMSALDATDDPAERQRIRAQLADLRGGA